MRRWFVLLTVLLSLSLVPRLHAQSVDNGNLTLIGALNHCGGATGGDAYACTYAPTPITAYTVGACYGFVADVANTGGATWNGGGGVKTITKVTGGITTVLATNDIQAGQIVRVCYDGTQMQCQNCLGNSAALPATMVLTDQSNAYSTGTQSFAAATAVIDKTAAGYAPTAAASRGYDTTQQTDVVGVNGVATFRGYHTYYAAQVGDTNDSSVGGGSDRNFSGTVTLPANTLNAGKIVRVCALYQVTSGSGPPQLYLGFKFGSTKVYDGGVTQVNTNKSGKTAWICARMLVSGALGGSANTYTASEQGNSTDLGNSLNTGVQQVAQPVALATNGSLSVVPYSQWDSAGVGVNQLTQLALTVEVGN